MISDVNGDKRENSVVIQGMSTEVMEENIYLMKHKKFIHVQ